jgi:hypothetical protein
LEVGEGTAGLGRPHNGVEVGGGAGAELERVGQELELRAAGDLDAEGFEGNATDGDALFKGMVGQGGVMSDE